MSKFKAIANRNIPANLVTRDVAKFVEQTGNVYEAVNILGRRARQISTSLKEELNEKLAEFASTIDNLEEVHENREQIEISKFYERLPKPTTLSTEEFLEGKIYWRRTEEPTALPGADGATGAAPAAPAGK